MTVGAVVSTVQVKVSVATLPAKSAPWIVIVLLPSAACGVKLHLPLASATATPMITPSSRKVSEVKGSVVPLSLESLVMRSLEELPVSSARATVTSGGEVSTVKESWSLPVLPARLVARTVKVCSPSETGGEKWARPFASATATPTIWPSSTRVSEVNASVDTFTLAFLVMSSLEELPVSSVSDRVTVGGEVSTVKVSEASPVLPAASVAWTVNVCCPSETSRARNRRGRSHPRP